MKPSHESASPLTKENREMNALILLTAAGLTLRVAKIPQDGTIVLAYGIKRAGRWAEWTEKHPGGITIPTEALDELICTLRELRD